MLLTPYIRSNSLALVDVDCIVSAMNELLLALRSSKLRKCKERIVGVDDAENG